MDLPPDFRRRVIDVFGDAGAAWLHGLPALLRECEERWSLTLAEPFRLSYNYAAPATTRDGVTVVLKAGVPHKELRSEIEALRHFDGRGAVQLLAADIDRGLLLLERLVRGTPLLDLGDDDAMTTAAADVMLALHRPPPADHAFPTVEDWGRGFQRLRDRFDGGTGPLPAQLVETAEAAFAELLASSAAPVVLHGDLHHNNVLRAAREPWLAIDPKGVVGEPAYEVGALLRKPHETEVHGSDVARTLARRIDLVSERLGVDRDRLVAWGMAQAVLSAWWSIEDHDALWEVPIALAETLAALR